MLNSRTTIATTTTDSRLLQFTAGVLIVVLCPPFARNQVQSPGDELTVRKLTIVDDQGRPRIELEASPTPAVAILDDTGRRCAVVGLVSSEAEFPRAILNSPFLDLATNGGRIVLGFEDMPAVSDPAVHQGLVATAQLTALGSTQDQQGGMMTRLSVGRKDANLGVVQLESSPVVRALLKSMPQGGSFLELRNGKGDLTFSTREKAK